MENLKNYPKYDFHGFYVITKLELVWKIPKGEFANIWESQKNPRI